jgi:hypothetical protein
MIAEVQPTIVQQIAQRFARLKAAIDSSESALVGELLTPLYAQESKLDESVRSAHLQMIQGVITRMGSNSFNLKTASTTLVAALLAYYGAVPSASWTVAVCGGIVVGVFWLMDANYLRLERLFRALYNKVRRAVTMDKDDFYSMDITPFQGNVDPIWKIAISWSTLWPYLVAILLLAVVLWARPAPTRDPPPPAPPPNGSVSPK